MREPATSPSRSPSRLESSVRYAGQLTMFAKAGLAMRRSWAPTLPRLLELHADRAPRQPMLRYRDRVFTYAEANAQVNRHAHAYATLGITKGDVVALFMENRPEFLWHVLGLAKLGAVSGLINVHLRDDVLLHAIRACEPSMVTVGTELADAFAGVRDPLPGSLVEASHRAPDPEQDAGPTLELPDLDDRLGRMPTTNPRETTEQSLDDLFTYIYTSGTTGLPKPALIRHRRLYQASHLWAGMGFKLGTDDVLYNCLPLYHTSALLLATGSVLATGCTMALERRFSATRFWDDIRAHGATRFIYIGEMCRYLLNQPPSARDREHAVERISGNGLRPDIWEEFQRRFDIPHIAEFYGATEGNAITLNTSGKPGSVGRMTPRAMALAAWDEDRDDFVRDDKGRLVKAKAEEPGILLGRITRSMPFEGYKDPKQTEQKILRGAFRKGDAWFNTGDLMKRDGWGYLYFVDRLGDTFRWKGENVAAAEVEAQLRKWSPAQEVAVYGVQIPGTEGRAGMAAVVLDDPKDFDGESLYAYVRGHLPVYAQPIFVRLPERLEKTSTMKVRKQDLQRGAYDPHQVRDPLYVMDPREGGYVPLTKDMYDRIQEGRTGDLPF